MAGDIFPLGQIWSDAQGWKTIDATEHMHSIGYVPKDHDRDYVRAIEKWHGGGYIPKGQPLFSMNDAPVYCELCRRAVNAGLNSTMRWPNDISGYPGDAIATIEEDGYGPITSRTKWLRAAGSDYR